MSINSKKQKHFHILVCQAYVTQQQLKNHIKLHKHFSNHRPLVFVYYSYINIPLDDIYIKIIPTNIQHRRNKSRSKHSDREIITISIVRKLHTVDSESAWYNYCRKNFKNLFPNFCVRSRFNRVCRSLHAVINEIRNQIVKLTGLTE